MTSAFHGCHLVSHREGEGPPVVFIQGVGVHGRGWTRQVEDLRANYECLVFDNRGMGESQPVGAALTIEQMAADTLWLMDDAGWESAHVVAHSMGGPIAIEMALSRPERVRSLALLCTVARGKDATTLTGRLLWLGLRSRIGTRRMRRRAFLEIIMPPAALRGVDRDALAAHLEPLFGHDLAEQPPIAMPQLSALRAYDATDRLSRLAGIHTLVMSAAHDPIAPPKYGRALAAGIPDARYIEFTDASHGLPLSHPARVNELLRGHLREAARAAGYTTGDSPAEG
jgi:pimeloyl-ACP methyl ester carboxylesterase